MTGDPFIAGLITGVILETGALIVCLALCAAAAAADKAMDVVEARGRRW